MTSAELALWIGALAAYTVVMLIVLRYALVGVVWIYRLFRPAAPPPEVIELEHGRDWRYVPDKSEPVFGPAAKNFAILFIAGLLIYPLVKIAFDDAFYGRIRALIDATLP